MSIKENQFKIKLKKCKSLQDYRDLAEEYNIQNAQDCQSCPKYRDPVIRKSIRNRSLNQQF